MIFVGLIITSFIVLFDSGGGNITEPIISSREKSHIKFNKMIIGKTFDKNEPAGKWIDDFNAILSA